MHLPSASNPSQLDSTEGVWGHGCGTIQQFGTQPVEHAVQKHPQWEVVVRLACLLLMQECNRVRQAWSLAGSWPSFYTIEGQGILSCTLHSFWQTVKPNVLKPCSSFMCFSNLLKAVVFPFLNRLLVVSHPVNAWHAGRLSLKATPNFSEISDTGMYLCLSP